MQNDAQLHFSMCFDTADGLQPVLDRILVYSMCFVGCVPCAIKTWTSARVYCNLLSFHEKNQNVLLNANFGKQKQKLALSNNLVTLTMHMKKSHNCVGLGNSGTRYFSLATEFRHVQTCLTSCFHWRFGMVAWLFMFGLKWRFSSVM